MWGGVGIFLEQPTGDVLLLGFTGVRRSILVSSLARNSSRGGKMKQIKKNRTLVKGGRP